MNEQIRRPIIAGNWKMNEPGDDAVAFARSLTSLVSRSDDVDVIICPPYTLIYPVKHVLDHLESCIDLGAQNLYWEKDGAYTGEISGPMLKRAGVKYVIVGHSERRTLFGETDEMVNKKLKAALEYGLIPIVCVGETLEQREKDETDKIVGMQLITSLEGITEKQILGVNIAYEPVWAIGTGKTAKPEQAEDVHLFIRNFLANKYYRAISENVRILYGGSVKPDNIVQLIAKPNIDGALVGGASLKVNDFAEIVRKTSDQYRR